MNKKLNKKIFSGVLALSFVFGSGLVSTVSENLGLDYSNVAYADYVWDIYKAEGSKWIEIEHLVRAGYPYVFAETPFKFTFKNGKVYYDYYDSDKHVHIDKPLPDKGYVHAYRYEMRDIGPTRDFLIDHGYEVMQEKLYGDITDPYQKSETSTTNFYDADRVLIWRKKAASNDPSNYPTASTGIVRYSGEDLNVSDLYAGGRNLRGTNPVTFSDGKTSKKVDNVTKETTKKEKLKVTFSDDSTTELSVSYTIKPLSDKYKDLSFDETKVPTPTVGDEVSLPDDIIKNLPEGASISKKDPIDTSKAGTVKPNVTVKFSDGSTKDVTVPVVVKDIELPKTLTKEELDGEYSKYKDKYAEVEFRSHDNKVLKTSYVLKNEAIKASDKVTVPTSTKRAGYTLTGWSKVELSQQ